MKSGTPVGVSLIDAYAGALGLLACHAEDPIDQRLGNETGNSSKLKTLLIVNILFVALVCGTSTCHMLTVSHPTFVHGVWGPYADVLLPGMWLLEGGQSATGILLDHIVETHPCYQSLKARLPETTPIPEELSRILHNMARSTGRPLSSLAKDIHVWPDFHGNRSPLADPKIKGMVRHQT